MFDAEEFMAELVAQGGPALAAAVEREFRTGWELQKRQALAREQARSAVPHARSGAVEGLGGVTSAISADSYFYWLNHGRQHLGVTNIWAEDEFRRDYLRDHPQARVGYAALKPVSGWTPGAAGAEATGSGNPSGQECPRSPCASEPLIVAGTKYGSVGGGRV